MTYRDADDAREASERGKKNEKFRELVDCVQIDINDATRFGLTHSSSKLSEENIAEFGEGLVAWFQELGFDANIEDRTIYLNWENREI